MWYAPIIPTKTHRLKHAIHRPNMKLLAILSSLAILHYLPRPKFMHFGHYLTRFYSNLDHFFNGGKSSNAVFIWLLGVLLPTLIVGALSFYCYKIHALIGLIFSVYVLYATLDFNNFGGIAQKIADALAANNHDEALKLIQPESFDHQKNDMINIHQMASLSIADLFKSAHYGLFALFLWFFIFGAAGAVLFSFSFLLFKHTHETNAYNDMAQKILTTLDWLPSYLTATCFAVVGDFEDAVYCWRTQLDDCKNKTLGSVLASGAGALGVKLDLSLLPSEYGLNQPLGMGEIADADYYKSAVGLVWRGLILLLGSFFLLTFAHFLGS